MWKNRNVWIILSGELIAGLGLWAAIIGNLEFMQRHVPSDFMKSVLLFIGLLAGVLVGPYAGKVIDSSRKKAVLLYAGAGRMAGVLFMFAALHYGSIPLMVLFLISIQVAAAFYFPALQALIPMVVPEKELLAMNGVHMNVATGARIAGTALAGLLLTVMSLYGLYMASFIAYGLLLAATGLLRVEEQARHPEAESARGRDRGRFIDMVPLLRGMPVVSAVLLLTTIPLLFIGGFNLLVISISDLQNDPTIKGLLYTVEGSSFIVGAFIVKRISNEKRILRLLFSLSFLIAAAQLSLVFADHRAASLFSFGLFGFGAGCFFPLVATVFQTGVPKTHHGRFFSFRNMFDRSMFQIVLLGTGLLLDLIGLQRMSLAFGVFSLLLAAFFAFRSRKTVAMNRAVEADGGLPL